MQTENCDDVRLTVFPKAPIDALVEPVKRFMHIEAASGVVLLLAAGLSMALANSSFADIFMSFWKTEFVIGIGSFKMSHSLQHWINDGLMVIFFYVVGLEVKREMVMGELTDMRKAALPIAGALGGMITPAAIFLSLQYGKPGAHGWGIPMATDIAFVVGCLALLGSRVPSGLRVMLLSLAIADDIGAILVIAIGYTEHLSLWFLGAALAGIAFFLLLMRLGVKSVAVYVMIMVIVWFFFHQSGIHATLAGVIFGLLTPTRAPVNQGALGKLILKAGNVIQGCGLNMPKERYHKLRQMEIALRKSVSPLERFEAKLHPWVAFGIMPLFALANAGVPISADSFSHPLALAVAAGLLAGKPVGIFVFSWLAVKTGLAKLPGKVSWKAIFAGGLLAGIGFTMALFIAGLAVRGPMLDDAKLGVILGSAASAVGGMLMLTLIFPRREKS